MAVQFVFGGKTYTLPAGKKFALLPDNTLLEVFSTGQAFVRQDNQSEELVAAVVAEG